MGKLLKHDFYDFIMINGAQTCKHCLMTSDNEYLPICCHWKEEA